jgi:xylan 1,4-beta-xylosidase
LATAVGLITLPRSVASAAAAAAAEADTFPVSIEVRADRPRGELKPIWRFFGADEPNYAYMKDGKKLLGELGDLQPDHVYFRAHNLLCTGDGTPALKWGSTNAYTEDAAGNAVHDWTLTDRIFDAYRAAGVRPYVQIGFMPKAMSTHPEPYQHQWRPGVKYEEIETGWAYPPKDFVKWGELAYQWAKHCVERYGKDEVEQWYWEVWNEPNGLYWKGTPEEWRKLHDYAIAGVRKAMPTARVGGPHTAGSGGQFARDFYDHCLHGTNYATGQKGTPLDFVSFHAKGAPKFVEGHVRMGIADQLREIDKGFKIIGSYPELKKTPIVIGESDPDGCAACQGPQLGYRNTTMYSSYTAAVFARKYDLAERHGVNLEGALTWAFTFEDQAPFAGFRQLASCGIDLPVLNVFRMFAKMTGQRVDATSDAAVPLDAMLKDGVRAKPDVGVLATRDGGKLAVLVWHYHDDDISGPAADVRLKLGGLSDVTKASARRFLVDAHHGNAYTHWLGMNSPQQPSAEQLKQLQHAGHLAEVEAPQVDGEGRASFALPRQAVSLLLIEYAAR